MGYFILLAFILILGNIVIANIDLETDKDSRKWKLLRENKQPKSIEFEKIEKIIWKMFLLQCYLIFAYSLFKCIQLIFSTEGEFLLKTSKLSYVVLFLSAVIANYWNPNCCCSNIYFRIKNFFGFVRQLHFFLRVTFFGKNVALRNTIFIDWIFISHFT